MTASLLREAAGKPAETVPECWLCGDVIKPGERVYQGQHAQCKFGGNSRGSGA